MLFFSVSVYSDRLPKPTGGLVFVSYGNSLLPGRFLLVPKCVPAFCPDFAQKWVMLIVVLLFVLFVIFFHRKPQ